MYIDLLPLLIKESFENSSHPMSDSNVISPDQIRSHFDSISYEKVSFIKINLTNIVLMNASSYAI